MKILIDSHSGAMCEARIEGTSFTKLGDSADEAVSKLLRAYFDIEIEVLPAGTAFEELPDTDEYEIIAGEITRLTMQVKAAHDENCRLRDHVEIARQGRDQALDEAKATVQKDMAVLRFKLAEANTTIDKLKRRLHQVLDSL
jgi:hypothetical protein